MPQDTSQKERADKSLNPSENHAGRLFDGQTPNAKSLNQQEGMTSANSDNTVAKEPQGKTMVSRSQSSRGDGQWTNKFTGSNDSDKSPIKNFDPGDPGSWQKLGKHVFKKGGPAGAIIGIVAAFFGISSGSGIMAPFMFVEGLGQDLNDQLVALDIGENNLIRNRNITGPDRAKVLKGCTTLSIRCKFATLSDTQVKRLARAGIEVSPTKTGPLGRIVPNEYKFRGNSYTPEQWNSELRSNGQARNAQRRANNMKYRGFADKTFVNRVLKRFGISKAPPGLKGSVQDRVNQLMTASGATDADGIKFTEVKDSDGNPVEPKQWELLDADGNPVKDADGNPKRYNENQHKKASEAASRAKTAKPPSVATSRIIGAASALGYYDLACSIKNMIGVAGVAAKVANQSEMIQFSWGLVSTVHQIKAGDGSPEDLQAVGEILMSEDGRKLISKVESGEAVEQVENPNYGKNAMSAPEILMSLNGGVAPRHEMANVFSMGGGMNSLLGGVNGFATIADAVLNVGNLKICNLVQNPFVRGAGILVSLAAAVSTGGTSALPQIAIAAAMISGMLILDHTLNSALEGSVIDVLLDSGEKVGVGTAGWGGRSGIEGSAAQARGLVPADTEQLGKQHSLKREVEQKYLAMERENINEFDITNQYSALGSIMRGIYKQTQGETRFGSIIKLASSIPSMFTSNILADGFDPRRFERCDDPEYENLGIDADVLCNVRYVMPEEDLAMGPDEVAVYMEQNYDIDETGYPRGYTPPDPSKSQNAIVGFLKGATVGQFFADRNTVNDYGKFLDYCAYRTAPYGKTFEESGLIGGAEEEWQTGAKCREKSEKLSNFRMFTLYKSIQEGIDDEEVLSYTQTGGSGSSGGGDSTDGLPAATGKFVSPIPPGAPGADTINAKYGYHGYGRNRAHWGVDLSAFNGDGSYDFVSACDGVVDSLAIKGDSVKNRNTGTSGTTNYAWIKCDSGVYMGYAHFYADTLKSYIKPGYKISAGTPIAPVGCQGNSKGNTVGREGFGCGTHLHFQVNAYSPGGYDAGSTVDPVAYMRRQGVKIP